MLPSGDCTPLPPGLASPSEPIGPVSEFIDWVSLVTVCDKFDSGPVDCN